MNNKQYKQFVFGLILSIVGLLISIPILKENFILAIIGFTLVVTGLIFIALASGD